MSDILIAAAFESTLKTWADAQTPAIPVAWENKTFTPPADGARYIRAHLLPAPAISTFFDGTGRTRLGIFQVSFCMPIGKGAGSARALVDSLDAAFQVSMVQSGLRIWLLRPLSPAPGIQEPDRFVVPASAEYKAVAV